MHSSSITVLIVDDHPVLREGLSAVIHAEDDMRVVAEAANGVEAIECFDRHRPQITLMDLRMPELDGLAATLSIRSRWPSARIVMLTTYRGDVPALRALKAGASGYLLKSMMRTHLLEAIRTVAAGSRYIPLEIASELAAHVADEALSDREVEVLRRIASGGANKAIASLLHLSEETVKSHIRNILAKLSANDRTHAVTIAIQRGIIEM